MSSFIHSSVSTLFVVLIALTHPTPNLLAQPPATAPATTPSPSKRPNILFLFSDDQCFDTLHSLGNSEIETPHLDRLVRRGTTFTHAYNMGSWHGAVCMPSRGMLNTGRFLWDYKSVDGHMKEELTSGNLWSTLLGSAGYKTHMAGKWHVPVDASQAFDRTGSVRPGMPNVVPQKHPHAYNRPIAGVPDTWDPANPEEGGFWQGGIHWSEVLASDVTGFVTDARQQDKPFFIYAAFNAPHDPRQAPREYLDRYPSADIRLPANFLPEYPYKDAIGCPHSLRDEFLAPMPRTPEAIRVHRSEYYALITHMDAQIGKILDALDATGQADNTWIFFTSDHGLAVGQHGLIGKQNLYDHSVRVPFIVVGPGVQPNQRIADPIYYQDVMPTTLEIAGVTPPEHVAYQSLLPILRGERRSKYPSIYTAYRDLQRAVTLDGWKLLLYPAVPKIRLFDLANDPMEMNDLAEDPAHTDRVRALYSELRRWQRETDDPLDLTVMYPDL